MYKYVILDVDGTMVDTEEAVMYAYQSVIFEKYGRHFSDEEMLKGYGVPTPQSLAKYGFTDIDKAMKDYYKYLIEGFARCSAFDGIFEVIDIIKAKNIPMGIVTSRCKYEIDIDTCLQSFINQFDSVVCSDDTTLHKPNPDPLLKAMEKMNANSSETIYIGDTVFDARCAKSAGVKFALALWGSNNAKNIDADYYLEKPLDLIEII
jgi:HAD superfamily hydrolase (TIGR01549 family)